MVGIEAACLLRESLSDATITIISKDAYHALDAHLPELLSGRTRIEDLHTNIKRALEDRKIEFIRGEISAVDTEHRTVHYGELHISYDILLLDLPRSRPQTAINGIERCLPLSEAKDFLELRQHVISQLIRARGTNQPEHKTFVVVGAGAQGIETASELRALLTHAAEKQFLFPEELTVVLVEQGLQVLPPRAHAKLLRRLEENDIEYYADQIHNVNPDSVELRDRSIETCTVVWSAGSRGNLTYTRLGIQLDELGDPILRDGSQTSNPHIFAVVDRAPIPRACRIDASMQVDLARNIVAFHDGKTMRSTRNPNRPSIITTGNGHALFTWNWFSCHGRLPYRIRRWLADLPAERLGKS